MLPTNIVAPTISQAPFHKINDDLILDKADRCKTIYQIT